MFLLNMNCCDVPKFLSKSDFVLDPRQTATQLRSFCQESASHMELMHYIASADVWRLDINYANQLGNVFAHVEIDFVALLPASQDPRRKTHRQRARDERRGTTQSDVAAAFGRKTGLSSVQRNPHIDAFWRKSRSCTVLRRK